jgi:quercetin dioxygenase-like cupin family protein
MKKYSWSRLDSENLTENITRKMLWGENIMVVRLELAPNTVVPEHDHVSEQVTMVLEGSIELTDNDGVRMKVGPGEICVIGPSRPHSAVAGSQGAVVMDLFSPIREDFIYSKPSYYSKQDQASDETKSEEEIHTRIHSILISSGVNATLEQVKQTPTQVLAGYVYEKGLVTMGQLRKIMGWDKAQAKNALREWKHGDDHSQSSYEKMRRTQVVLPWEQPIGRPKKQDK